MKRNPVSNFFRYISPVVIIGLFLAVSIQSALAQEATGDIKLSARAGLGGYCKEGRWIPVTVKVENSGPDVKAQIQILNPSTPESKPFAAADISLPGTSRKELFLPVYPQSFLRKIKVRVVAYDKVLAETDLNITCVGTQDFLIGLLADIPSNFDVLADLKPLTGDVKIASIHLDELPNQVLGLAELDALIISGVDTTSWSNDQRQALELWVADGGKLFVIGGPKWQTATAGVSKLLPVELHSTQKVPKLDALQQYLKVESLLEGGTILAVGTLRPDAYALVEQDGIPLWAEKPIGLGQVYFLAADPGLQPLSRWDGMRAVYEFSLARKSFNVWDTTWRTDAANRALSVLPSLGMPSIFFACCLALVYLIFIGPLNYLFLRRIKRMELAWISIPVLVIIFTVITYVAGSVSRGTKPMVSRMGVVFSWDGVNRSQVRGLAGIYSPYRAKYILELEHPLMALPLNQSDVNFTNLQQDMGMTVPDFAVEIGGMKSISVDGDQPALPLSHDLSFNFASSGVITLKGSITNPTPYSIEQATLVFSDNSESLGNFAPGETKEINIIVQHKNFNFNSVFSKPNYNPYYSSYTSPTEDDTSYRREYFSQALSLTHPTQMAWGVYVTGWLKNESVPLKLRDKVFDALDTNLVYWKLNPLFSMQGNSVTIPNSFMLWESSTDQVVFDYDRNIQIPNQGYFLRFWPAIPIQFSSVKSLVLFQNLQGQNQTNPIISIWSFKDNRWYLIDDLSRTQIDISDPDQFVGPGGEIRLQLNSSNQSYNYVNVDRLDVELTVNK